MRDDPGLRGRPLAIGGASDRRGVVATCNYEARAFGVHSAMPTSMAKQRCPQLIVRPPNMEKYRDVAYQVRAIFERYSDVIEPLSLDEAYLDVSDSQHFSGSASRIAAAIRAEVRAEVGITISAGVAPNKFLAKVASDWDKPDGLTVITPAQVADFVVDLPVKKIHGVGKVMAGKLAALGVETCGQLQAWSELALIEEFGRFGRQLYGYARGIDNRTVGNNRQRKSLSVERTFAADIPELAAAEEALAPLLVEMTRRLDNQRGLVVAGAFIKLKSDNFQTTTVERRQLAPVPESCFRELLGEAWQRLGRPVRLIGAGVRFASPREGDGEQLTLF